jgi:hypothetical protein
VHAPRIAMPQSFACLHYHLIFSTKGRAPFLVGDLPDRGIDPRDSDNRRPVPGLMILWGCLDLDPRGGSRPWL